MDEKDKESLTWVLLLSGVAGFGVFSITMLSDIVGDILVKTHIFATDNVIVSFGTFADGAGLDLPRLVGATAIIVAVLGICTISTMRAIRRRRRLKALLD